MDKLEKPLGPTFSQGVVDVIGRKAVGTTQAENLLDKAESLEMKDLRNAIESQAETSLCVAATMINYLNTLRESSDQIQIPTTEEMADIFEVKLDQWEQDGSLNWCNEYIKQNGGDINLVVTPNILVTPEELISLAQNFGKTQTRPIEAMISEHFYKRLSPQELSGPQYLQMVDGIIPIVRLSLIPSVMSVNLHGTVEHQKQTLKSLQSGQQNIRLPSPLDAVASWYTLRANGDELGSNAGMKTYIHHFDIEDKRPDGWIDVPASLVHTSGVPELSDSWAGNERHARLALG